MTVVLRGSTLIMIGGLQMATTWIPKFIKKVFEYKSLELVTPEEFNAILNLLVTQGDYNASWLDYLTTTGIPDALVNLNQEVIAQAITETVQEAIASMAASVTNKTSAKLQQPTFVFIDESPTTSANGFRTLLASKGVVGCLSAYPGLIGSTGAYTSLADLQVAKAADFDVVPHGWTTASLEDVTVTTVLSNIKNYMITNALLGADDVMVYPGGSATAVVELAVESLYGYGIKAVSGTFDSDAFDNGAIKTVLINTTNTALSAVVQDAIVDAVQHNNAVIFRVDSSAVTYSAAELTAVITQLLAMAGISITTISDLFTQAETTINNRLQTLEDSLVGWEINYFDESGVATLEPYVHWTVKEA